MTSQELAGQMSQAQVHLALEASGVGMWDWDLLTNQINWTDQGRALLGWSSSTPINYERFLATVHPQDREPLHQFLARVIAEQSPYQTEYRVLWPDSSLHWLSDRGYCLSDTQGHPRHMVGAVIDITDLKQAEEARRESEARLRKLVEANIIGVMMVDLQGQVYEANDAFLELLGYSREDLLAGRINWKAMTPPEDQAASAQAVQELQTTGVAQPYEKAFLRKDGRRVPVLVGSTILREEGSAQIAIGFIIDLTAQKAAEEQRQEADRRIGKILASITDIFAHIDAQWRYSYVNQRTEEYTGKSREALLGRNYWEMNPQMLGTPMEQRLREAMASQQTRHFEAWHPQWQRWLEVHAYPAEGGLSLYSQDITKRKQVEEALRESEARLRGLVDSNIIGIFVHDLEGRIYEVNICQMLIAQHQGQVGVESRPGEGSTFWFTLPLAPQT